MVMLDPIKKVVGFDLSDLDGDDWRVLDFAICALKDKVSKDQKILNENQKISLDNLHTCVLEVLRGDW